jgi:hypothetical protein
MTLVMDLKDILAEDLMLTAKRLINHYKKEKYKVLEAGKIDEIAYKFHLICQKNYETVAIEIRKSCNIESFHERFIDNCQAKQLPIKIYFAVPDQIDEIDILIPITHTQRLRDKGIGLLIVKEDRIIEEIGTVKCNQRISLDPLISLGLYKKDILTIIKRKNIKF